MPAGWQSSRGLVNSLARLCTHDTYHRRGPGDQPHHMQDHRELGSHRQRQRSKASRQPNRGGQRHMVMLPTLSQQ